MNAGRLSLLLYKLDVLTKQRFRCRCAETWLNLTTDASSDSPPRCKSVLYNEITRECSLNQGDHNGK